VGPLPSAKNKWHIHNALDAKITAGLVHNGERGLYMHILWLYNSSISQSYTLGTFGQRFRIQHIDRCETYLALSCIYLVSLWYLPYIYRGFTCFGGICSGIPRLNTARHGTVRTNYLVILSTATERGCDSCRLLTEGDLYSSNTGRSLLPSLIA
jgi:hypothetical protein